MRKIKVLITLLAVLVVFSLVSQASYAFWLWTPKGNTMLNPKFAVKDTPEEQYDWAMRFYKAGDFKRAAEEFVRLIASYKDSDIAPEAQYYAGRSYEELGKYYYAYQNYQKTIENYPYTKRMDELIEREYNIANIFQSRMEPKLMDLELSLSTEKSIEIYGKIVENSPFSEYADKSLYQMGENYRRLGKYNEAIDAYNRILNDYPQSALLADARHQLAFTTYEASLDADYDQESTELALKKFKQISENTDVPAEVEEADKAITVLREKKSQSLLSIASFYEKRGKAMSALMYYKDILNNFPDTGAARIAEVKVERLEKRVKK